MATNEMLGTAMVGGASEAQAEMKKKKPAQLAPGLGTQNTAPEQQPQNQGAAGTQAAAQPTFAQLQQQGRARPAPPPPAPPTPAPGTPPAQQPPAGGGTYGGGAYGGNYGANTTPVQVRNSGDVQNATRQQLLAMLQNPAGFGQNEVAQWYQTGAQQIDDEFSQARTAAEEEMARRGLSASSTLGGRLADLNVAKRSAQVDLRDRLGRQLAEELSRSRDAAVGRGIQFDEYMTNSDLQAQRLGLEGDRLNLDRDLGFGRINLDAELGRDRNNISRLGISEDARQFNAGYDLDRAEFGEGQYRFDEDMGLKRDDLGLRRDMFGEERRQFDEGLGQRRSEFDRSYDLDNREFDWAKDRDLADILERTTILNPDTTPDFDTRELYPEEEGWW